MQDFIKVPYFQYKKFGKWSTLLRLLSFELALFFKLFVLNFSDFVQGIYLRQSNLNFAVPLISKLFKRKFIIESNSLLLEDLKESGVRIVSVLEKKLEKFAFQNAVHIRVITINMKKYLMSIFSLEESLFSVIPNGYNFKKYNSNIKESFNKTENSYEFRLLYAGLLHKREGVHILIEALSRLKDRSYFRLDIIGDGPHQQDFKEQTAKFNLSNKIFFLWLT